MKISTKGRYSLVFMLDMARHFGSEPVKVKDKDNAAAGFSFETGKKYKYYYKTETMEEL